MGNSNNQDEARTFNWTTASFVLVANKEKILVKEMVAVLSSVHQSPTLDGTNKLELLPGDLDVGKKHQKFTLMSLKPCVSLTGQPNVSMELTEIITALGSETDGLNMSIVNIRRKLMIMRKMLKKKKEGSPTLAHPQKEKPSGKISEVIIKISKR